MSEIQLHEWRKMHCWTINASIHMQVPMGIYRNSLPESDLVESWTWSNERESRISFKWYSLEFDNLFMRFYHNHWDCIIYYLEISPLETNRAVQIEFSSKFQNWKYTFDTSAKYPKSRWFSNLGFKSWINRGIPDLENRNMKSIKWNREILFRWWSGWKPRKAESFTYT